MELNEGADLWVIANRKNSSWAQKLDWYLNFQISRSTLHASPRLNAEHLKNLEWAETESYEEHWPNSSPMLVGVDGLLPCRILVRIPFNGDGRAWVQEGIEVAQRLNSLRIRFFLPKQINSETAQKWSENSNLNLEFVEEKTSL